MSDIVYLENLKVGFIYDLDQQCFVKFDQDFLFTDEIPGKIDLNFGKMLRRNQTRDTVFLNSGHNQLTVVSQITQEGHLVSKIKNISGSNIQDFRPFAGNKIAVLSTDGMISVYQYTQEAVYSPRSATIAYKRLTFWKIKLDPNEETIALAIDARGQHLAVTTFNSEAYGGVIARLYYFKIKPDFKLKKLYTLKFKQDQKIPDLDYYCFYELNMDFWVESKQHPLILLFQYTSEFKVFSFVFNGRKMTEYKPPFSYHTAPFFKCVESGGRLWSVDADGVINGLSHQGE